MMAQHAKPFPATNARFMLLLYRLIWTVCLPLVLLYLYLRSRKEPAYFANIGERFGFHKPRDTSHIWIHAVSLGELRSAAPLITRLLAGSLPVVTTHLTPAGRHEAERLFPAALADGRLTACYVPFDYGRAFCRFFRAFRPIYGLVMEVEFWPGMIVSSHRQGVPLLLCNGQYPSRNFERDQKRFFSRTKVVPGFAGVMVKSNHQAARFRSLEVQNIAVTGEMRFEQTIPKCQIDAARMLRAEIAGKRPIVTLASLVAPEESAAMAMIRDVSEGFSAQGQPKPLFIVVPRAPERFTPMANLIAANCTSLGLRSQILDDNLATAAPQQIAELDILLGDSIGEMYFYLGLCDLAIVGGGFCYLGSHNISEPLCAGKPVIIGPNDYTIEFPAREAIAQGVCRQMDWPELTSFLKFEPLQFCSSGEIDSFITKHSGSTEKTLQAIATFLHSTNR